MGIKLQYQRVFYFYQRCNVNFYRSLMKIIMIGLIGVQFGLYTTT